MATSAPQPETDLKAILAGITEIKQSQREMNVKLFGEVEGENKEGRLPRLERRVDQHSTRLDGHDRIIWKAVGAAALAVVIVELLIRGLR